MPTNMRAAVYGVITLSVLLATERAKRETYAETVAALALAMLINWIAHGYSEFASRRLREGERVTPVGLAMSMLNEAPILAGAALPLVAVLICWAVQADLNSAVDAALWTTVATIIGIEVVAGARAELSSKQLVAQALVGAALGVLALTLKLVFH